MKCAEEEHSCGQVRRAGCCLMILDPGALVERSRLPNGPKPPSGQRDWGMAPLENKDPHLDGSAVDAR